MLSYSIFVNRAVKPIVLNNVVEEYREYDVVDVIPWKYVEREPDGYTEYYEVFVEIVLKKENDVDRVEKKYLAVYDSITKQCIEISEIKE